MMPITGNRTRDLTFWISVGRPDADLHQSLYQTWLIQKQDAHETYEQEKWLRVADIPGVVGDGCNFNLTGAVSGPACLRESVRPGGRTPDQVMARIPAAAGCNG